MATYLELYDLAATPGVDSAEVEKKIAVAVMIEAQAYLADVAATPAQKQWAVSAVADAPALTREARRVWLLVLAAFESTSVAAIQSASDAAVQSAVSDVVAQIAEGSTGA